MHPGPPKEHIHIKPSKGKEAHMQRVLFMARWMRCPGGRSGRGSDEWYQALMSLSMEQWKKHAQSCRKTPFAHWKIGHTKVSCTSDPELSMHHKNRICIACDWILVLLHSPDASIASSYRLFKAAAFELLHIHTSISQNLLIFLQSPFSLPWYTSNWSSW